MRRNFERLLALEFVLIRLWKSEK